MNIIFSLSAAGILLVFYLYLLAKPQCIKRGAFFQIGAAGLVLTMISGFFSTWGGRAWADVLVGLFGTIGVLVAFLAAIVACYGGKLPMKIPGTEAENEGQ